MTAHHDRVRAILVVHALEADRRSRSGEGAEDIVDLAARVTRVQARLGEIRSRTASGRVRDQYGDVGIGPDADEWLLAVYDAALVQLCAALGVEHWLVEDAVCSESERQRVELELLSSVLPFR